MARLADYRLKDTQSIELTVYWHIRELVNDTMALKKITETKEPRKYVLYRMTWRMQ